MSEYKLLTLDQLSEILSMSKSGLHTYFCRNDYTMWRQEKKRKDRRFAVVYDLNYYRLCQIIDNINIARKGRKCAKQIKKLSACAKFNKMKSSIF